MWEAISKKTIKRRTLPSFKSFHLYGENPTLDSTSSNKGPGSIWMGDHALQAGDYLAFLPVTPQVLISSLILLAIAPLLDGTGYRRRKALGNYCYTMIT